MDLYLTPLTIINLNWIKHLNVRPETIKLLEENIVKKLLDNGLGHEFLNKGLISQTYKKLILLNSKKINLIFKNWAKELNRHFFQRRYTNG